MCGPYIIYEYENVMKPSFMYNANKNKTYENIVYLSHNTVFGTWLIN